MFDPEMGEAYVRDHDAQRRLKDLRATVVGFLRDPPSRAHRLTLEALDAAVKALDRDIAHVDKVWD